MSNESVKKALAGEVTRRTFLRAGAAAGVGYTFGIRTGAFAGVSPNEKLNIGMIGVGGKGESNYFTFGTMGQNIVALCDVDEVHAARVLNSNKKAAKYSDFREMLEKEKTLDAVIISIPDHLHASATIMAMKLGRHVYTEKPMAHSIYEAREMTRVARETKLVTQMGNHGHGGPILREAVEIVQSGAIGKVREFHAWTNRPTWPQGIEKLPEPMPVPATLQWNLWLGPAAERPYSDAYLPRKWRGWWDFGTGALGDMACHVMDLGFWALKLGYPVSVEAETAPLNPYTGPLWSIIRYKFPERGDLPPVTLTWYDGGKTPDPALLDGETPPGEGGSILIGDEGKLFVPDTYGAKYKLLPEEKFKDYVRPAPVYGRPKNHYMEWIDACKGGPKAMSNFADYAGLLTETILIGNVAMRAGKKVEWDGPNMKASNCPEAAQFVRNEYREGWKV